VTCEKIITFPEILISCHYIWYSREKIRKMELDLGLHKHILTEAGKAAGILQQKLDQFERYLFVKICHMFS